MTEKDMIRFKISRKNNQIIWHVWADKSIEDFFKNAGNEARLVEVYGRYWKRFNDAPLYIWPSPLQEDDEDASWTLTPAGKEILTGLQRMNIAWLRLKGISDGVFEQGGGVTFMTPSIMCSEQRLIQYSKDLAASTQRFFRDVLMPIDVEQIISIKERRDGY